MHEMRLERIASAQNFRFFRRKCVSEVKCEALWRGSFGPCSDHGPIVPTLEATFSMVFGCYLLTWFYGVWQGPRRDAHWKCCVRIALEMCPYVVSILFCRVLQCCF